MIAQASPAAGPLQTDPSKRVNYTLGLVLGVDEFQQDQLYHAAGRRGHNRLLHGYGTVWGLRVGPVTQGADPEIQVDAGVAVDPVGREIRVPDRMCVKVNRWLDRHQATLRSIYGNTPAQKIPVAVVLCHRECPTDTVPVPGEPCRSQEDAMQPSRIRESFELKLMLRDDAPWNPPLQTNTGGLGVFRLHHPEEQAVRAFGELLARVQSTTDPLLGEHGRADLLAAVRALVHAADEGELASPPPATDDPILLPAADAPDILREAFRVWVTEVRPAIRAQEDPGACEEEQCCVLLAEYDLPVTDMWAVQAGTTADDAVKPCEDRRPYLLHTRLLQEWLIAAGGEEGRPDVDTFATLQILGPNRVRAWVHHDEWLYVPETAITFVLNDQALDPSQIHSMPWAGIRNVWDVVIRQDMSDGDVVEIRFDTEQITLIEGPPQQLSGEYVVEAVRGARPRLRAGDEGGFVVTIGEVKGLEAGWTPADGDPLEPQRSVADELRGPSGEYLDRYGWILSAFTVYDRIEGGDLEGEYKEPIVAKIQQTPVSRTRPSDTEHYLRYDGAKWAPAFLDNGKIDLSGRYPNSKVVGIQGKTVDATEPLEHQYLVFDGARWVPAFLPDGTRDLSGRYPDSLVDKIQGTPVSNATPQANHYFRYDDLNGTWAPLPLPDSTSTSDLSGKYPTLAIERLQGRTVDTRTNAPAEQQALAFVGGTWVPADAVSLLPAAGGDLTGTYPDPTIAKLQGTTVTAPNPAPHEVLTFDGTEWVPAPVAFAGATSDLTGDAPNTTIARLQGQTVTAPNPALDQVLSFNGTAWVPAAVAFSATSDLTGDAPDTTIARLQGNPVAAEAPAAGQVLSYDGAAWVPGGVAFSAASDLTGDAPDTTIARLQGNPVAAEAPAAGQVLAFDGAAWVPGGVGFSAASDLTGDAPDTTIASLQGIPLQAQGPEPDQVLSFNGTAWVPAPVGFSPDSDLTGNAPATTIARLQGNTVSAANPAPSQVLTFNGTAWVPGDPPSGGGGPPAGDAGGDLGGTYPTPHVANLQGRALIANAPAAGQYLRFTGDAWMPDHAVAAPGGAYEIVGAGVFIAGPTNSGDLDNTYNAMTINPVGQLGSMIWRLDGFPYDRDQFQYIVKGTWEQGAVLLSADTDDPDTGLVRPSIRLVPLGEEPKDGVLHLEVSAYPRDVNRPALRDADAFRTSSAETAGAEETSAPAPAKRKASRTPRKR